MRHKELRCYFVAISTLPEFLLSTKMVQDLMIRYGNTTTAGELLAKHQAHPP
jgi:hypothetical protein